MDLFVPARFKTSIQLSPAELAGLGVSFEQTLLDKLKATHETVCTRFGYIRRGSLSILKRSAGNFIKQHFNGYIKFELLCRAEVCNPTKGSVYEAVVRNKNALGVHAEVLSDGVPVLDIIIPKRAAGIQSEIALDELQDGDAIYAKVLSKKYQLNDRFISVIACAVQKPGAAAHGEGAVGEAEGAYGDAEAEADGDGDEAELAGGSEAPDDSDGASEYAFGEEPGDGEDGDGDEPPPDGDEAPDAPARSRADDADGLAATTKKTLAIALAGDRDDGEAEGGALTDEYAEDDAADGDGDDDGEGDYEVGAGDDSDGSSDGGSDDGDFFRD